MINNKLTPKPILEVDDGVTDSNNSIDIFIGTNSSGTTSSGTTSSGTTSSGTTSSGTTSSVATPSGTTSSVATPSGTTSSVATPSVTTSPEATSESNNIYKKETLLDKWKKLPDWKKGLIILAISAGSYYGYKQLK
jgi:hypothetical protein